MIYNNYIILNILRFWKKNCKDLNVIQDKFINKINNKIFIYIIIFIQIKLYKIF
jgi:hypothetical protein